MPRVPHPNKEIESALRFVQSRGWKIIEGGGHCWGKLYCPWNSANCRCGEFCIVSIWSTPKDPSNFARLIKRVVKNCAIEKAVSGGMDPDTEHPMNYEFTLKFQVSDRHDIDALLECLALHGCDDTLVGIGQPGRLALSFDREASSADQAIQSALSDVQRAVPTAILIEATPDLVGLTDVAELIGVSRQNMRKLMLVHSIDFPPPVHQGRTCLWHLADILAWLHKRGTYPVRQHVIELAHSAMVINIRTAYERVFGAVKPAS